jgi:hypothetical protein
MRLEYSEPPTRHCDAIAFPIFEFTRETPTLRIGSRQTVRTRNGDDIRIDRVFPSCGNISALALTFRFSPDDAKLLVTSHNEALITLFKHCNNGETAESYLRKGMTVQLMGGDELKFCNRNYKFRLLLAPLFVMPPRTALLCQFFHGQSIADWKNRCIDAAR